MKKTLLTLALTGTMLSIGNNVFSQKMKHISPRKVKSVELSQTKGQYSDRLRKIKSLKDGDYENMLSEIKDVRDAEIYCTKIMKHPYEMDNLDSIIYGEDDYWASFKESYLKEFGDCEDGAIAAASLLYDNGFPPYFLSLEGKEEGHVVFLYKNKEGKFGTIGVTDIDCIRPKYKNISKIVWDFQRLVDEDLNYRVFDASEIFPKAIHSEGINYDEF